MNTQYRLSAFIKGSGQIGVNVGGSNYNSNGGGSSYEQVSVEFNSGSATSATIFAKYSGGEGRFDSFTLKSIDGGSTGGGDTVNCTGSSYLAIQSACDDGTNDGHGPANTIDDSLLNESRWSSNGNGKSITYDLGVLSNAKSLDLVGLKAISVSLTLTLIHQQTMLAGILC